MFVQGYLMAVSASAYSYVSMLQRFGPIMNPGGAAVSLTYLASQQIIPGGSGAFQTASTQFAEASTVGANVKSPSPVNMSVLIFQGCMVIGSPRP